MLALGIGSRFSTVNPRKEHFGYPWRRFSDKAKCTKTHFMSILTLSLVSHVFFVYDLYKSLYSSICTFLVLFCVLFLSLWFLFFYRLLQSVFYFLFKLNFFPPSEYRLHLFSARGRSTSHSDRPTLRHHHPHRYICFSLLWAPN